MLLCTCFFDIVLIVYKLYSKSMVESDTDVSLQWNDITSHDVGPYGGMFGWYIFVAVVGA